MAINIDEIDKLFLTLAESRLAAVTSIACLYTGKPFPSSCSPMALDPTPGIGFALDETFGRRFTQALVENPAIHDGAMMFGRGSIAGSYYLTGWSFRLFPPSSTVTSISNRGSAFNSCLAMSFVESVDRLYIVSGRYRARFSCGEIVAL